MKWNVKKKQQKHGKYLSCKKMKIIGLVFFLSVAFLALTAHSITLWSCLDSVCSLSISFPRFCSSLRPHSASVSLFCHSIRLSAMQLLISIIIGEIKRIALIDMSVENGIREQNTSLSVFLLSVSLCQEDLHPFRISCIFHLDEINKIAWNPFFISLGRSPSRTVHTTHFPF